MLCPWQLFCILPLLQEAARVAPKGGRCPLFSVASVKTFAKPSPKLRSVPRVTEKEGLQRAKAKAPPDRQRAFVAGTMALSIQEPRQP